MRRTVVAALLVAVAQLLAAAPASADAPGPTDYRSEVLSIEPDSGVVSATFVGGDSLVEMSVRPGHDVVVVGYRGEPYLWFRPDGTVARNSRSPSTYLNEDRYGALELPEQADADAEPDWDDVADDGVFAWHDHRTHWMSRDRPIGAEPGDQVLEAVLPLDVDGDRVEVTVGSWWVAAPSQLPAVAGVVVGGAVAVLAVRRGPSGVSLVALAASLVALALGATAWLSVPAGTGPDPMLWLLPLLGSLAALVGLAVARDPDADRSAATRDWLDVAAGIVLVVWSCADREALVRPILPTDAPWPLHRGVLAAVATTGALVVGVSLWQRVRATRPRPTVGAA